MTPEKSTVFKYIPHHRAGPTSFLPLLDVVINYRKSLPIRAFVDSGASSNFLPRIYAHRIGLLEDDDRFQDTSVKGISGPIKAKELVLKSIKILHKGEVFDVFFNPTVLVPSTDDWVLDFMILGTGTLFKKYDITFSAKHRKLILAKN